jgi:hypothetical protein
VSATGLDQCLGQTSADTFGTTYAYAPSDSDLFAGRERLGHTMTAWVRGYDTPGIRHQRCRPGRRCSRCPAHLIEYHAVRWTMDSDRSGTLGGTTACFRINTSGQVAGYSQHAAMSSPCVRWTGTTATDLRKPRWQQQQLRTTSTIGAGRGRSRPLCALQPSCSAVDRDNSTDSGSGPPWHQQSRQVVGTAFNVTGAMRQFGRNNSDDLGTLAAVPVRFGYQCFRRCRRMSWTTAI